MKAQTLAAIETRRQFVMEDLQECLQQLSQGFVVDHLDSIKIQLQQALDTVNAMSNIAAADLSTQPPFTPVPPPLDGDASSELSHYFECAARRSLLLTYLEKAVNYTTLVDSKFNTPVIELQVQSKEKGGLTVNGFALTARDKKIHKQLEKTLTLTLCLRQGSALRKKQLSALCEELVELINNGDVLTGTFAELEKR